jgi:hypothetical protein
MSQPTIVRKSRWRWIAHVATFIAALLGTFTVTVSAHSTDLYQYGSYPTPQYQAPPQYYYVGGSPNCPSCGCGQCGCAPCGCGQCGCGPCAVSVQPPPRVVIERRIVKHEYIERRFTDGCCQEQSYGYSQSYGYPQSYGHPPRPHAVVEPYGHGQRNQFPWGYGGVRGQPPYGYYR